MSWVENWPFKDQGKRSKDNSGKDISVDSKGEMAHAMI